MPAPGISQSLEKILFPENSKLETDSIKFVLAFQASAIVYLSHTLTLCYLKQHSHN